MSAFGGPSKLRYHPRMQTDTLDVLRCPYCGGRLNIVTSFYHRRVGDEICDGVLGCHCCIFPVVAGIPVLHLQPAAVLAREHLEAGRPELAMRAMVGLTGEAEVAAFEAAAASNTSTYRDVVEALGPNFEGGYFLYRFTDPTYLVAHAVVRAVGRAVLQGRHRAADICGGSGHLTRALMDLSSAPPVLADLSFSKVWLARRFTAPGCEGVCCDGNASLPFARGAFGLAMCSDAFHYIWTKRQFVAELARLIDQRRDAAVVISHTHNQLAWSPAHGQPLSLSGYRGLFETLEPRIFGEMGLLGDVVKRGPLDLSRHDSSASLDADPALTIVASRHPGPFRPHALDTPPSAARGAFRVNPLYESRVDGAVLRLTLRFPSADYEDEFGRCREYLPEEASVNLQALRALQAGGAPGPLADLIRQRVIVDLPKRYY